ncbi:SDR family oxidoreductase [Metallumcola ferriviriculae]|uniref:SDR family oxidoreductase n=1 Tax=Metallumcola ferriviriculae TaxID=3039180 RepID=A0AAU0UP73_9FIRM|nr:SDR family oxidoreductase [Desulfitibacteraceae bacterium MK1]
MSKLNGKYAVVTGGSRGIGAAIVQRFLDDGVAGVAILEWDFNSSKDLAKKLDSTGDKVLPINCDVSKEEQVVEAIKTTLDKFGTIDILVNNAGITRDDMFHKMSKEAWNAVINVNLYGTYHTCKYVVPIMREKRYGRIVNISSVSAFGNVGQANYVATKGAIISFTTALALEGGPKNITANCIAPGFINTDMYQAVPEAIIAEHKKMIPLKRLGEPEEVAGAVSFLASDDASFISSQCLIVSGGRNSI